MPSRLCIVLTAIAGMLLLGHAGSTAATFAEGERLVYELRWGLFSAGECVLEATPLSGRSPDGERLFLFELRVQTSGMIESVYPVNNRISAFCEVNLLRSREYEKHQREDKHRRDERIVFDWEAGSLHGWNNEHRFYAELKQPMLLDPLSAIYHMRTLGDLKVGSAYPIPITDGEHVELCQVEVLCKEKVNTPAGEFMCYKIQPLLGEVRGIFRKRGDAPIYIWLTADNRRLPVMLKSKAPVGSFKAKLRSVGQ